MTNNSFADETADAHSQCLMDAWGRRSDEQDERLRPQGPADRTQHQKSLLCAFGSVHVLEDVPASAKQGPFAKGGRFRAAIRFSSGQGVSFSDRQPDVRGVGVKFFPSPEQETDLLVTNEGGRSHARTAAQFVDAADVLADIDQLLLSHPAGWKRLYADVRRLSLREGLRMTGVLLKETVFRRVRSLAAERYWGSVVELGQDAVKYSLQPVAAQAPSADSRRRRPDFLRADLLRRLEAAPVRFALCLQFFIDESKTPVKDASVAWDSPLVRVGEIEIPGVPEETDEQLIERMAFNPGNGFAALGITHARRELYIRSAQRRGAMSSAELRPHFKLFD